MWLLYLVVNNFGVAVILFTLVVKLASFPLTLKQQRNMAFSQLFTPRVQEIQRKYRGNQAKLQEEMQKLQKEGYNPMGGCAPMILVIVLLFGVIDVVYKPMTHIERFEWIEKGSIEQVTTVAEHTDYAAIVLGNTLDSDLINEYFKSKDENPDLLTISDENPQNVQESDFVLVRKTGVTREESSEIGKYIADNFAALTDTKKSRLSVPVINELKTTATVYKGLQSELYAVQSFANNSEAFKTPEIHGDIYDKLEKLQSNMIFLGIDLGRRPEWAFDPIVIIPILSLLFSAVQIFVSQVIQRKSMPDVKMPGGKAMLLIMPFFSLFLAFTVPAGAGFYWGISYLFGIAQSLVIYKFWPPEKMREEAAQKAKEKTVQYQTTAVVKDMDENGERVEVAKRISDMSSKEQKEYYKKKLEAARLEDARKYGDTPVAPESETDETD